MIDVTYGTYISEYVLAGLCMAVAFFLQYALPVPAQAWWLQSQGRFVVVGGWRSAQQKSAMLLHLVFFSIASGLSGLSRFVSAAEDIDNPDTLASIVVWRFALLTYSISGFGLARFCIWTLFSRDPPSPSAFASTSAIVHAYYCFHVFLSQLLKSRYWPLYGYIPAWILVLIVGVACFARHRRAPILLFVIAAALFLTAAFFTRPKEDNVVTRRGWSDSLPRQFNENAIFNVSSIASEALLFAAGLWAVRNGLVHGILHYAAVEGGEKRDRRVAPEEQEPDVEVQQVRTGRVDGGEGDRSEDR